MSSRHLVVALVAVGCATTSPPAPAPPPPAVIDAGTAVTVDASEATRTPAQVAREPTPVERARHEGLVVFMRVCGPCHMAMWSVPSGGHLPALRWAEAAMLRQIREGSRRDGGRAMPAISTERLPESDVPALLAYLRSIDAVASP